MSSYTFDFRNDQLVKVNAAEEVVESWKLQDAPKEFLRAALKWNDRNGDYDEDFLTTEDLRSLVSIQFVED